MTRRLRYLAGEVQFLEVLLHALRKFSAGLSSRTARTECGDLLPVILARHTGCGRSRIRAATSGTASVTRSADLLV
jgi:hypothetical protein